MRRGVKKRRNVVNHKGVVLIQKAPDKYRVRAYDDTGKLVKEVWVASSFKAGGTALDLADEYGLETPKGKVNLKVTPKTEWEP